MALWGGRLWARELIHKRSWRGEALLLLRARMKHFHLGARHRSCRLGCMRRPWQAVVLCFGLVRFRQGLAERSLTGQLFIARTLWFFLLRGLPQRQSLFGQKIEGRLQRTRRRWGGRAGLRKVPLLVCTHGAYDLFCRCFRGCRQRELRAPTCSAVQHSQFLRHSLQ